MSSKDLVRSSSVSILKSTAVACALCLSAGWGVASADPSPMGKGHHHGDRHHGNRNVSVVKDVYADLGKGDLAGILANFAPGSKWILHGPAGIPFAGTHTGLVGIKAFFESFGSNAQVQVFETRDFIADKDQVVVMGYEEATAKPTGKTWKAHWAHVFTLSGGKIILVEEVVDTAPILAAFQP